MSMKWKECMVVLLVVVANLVPAISSVVSVSPPAESCTGTVTSLVSITSSQPLQPTTVSTNTFRVHAGQWGWCKGTTTLSGGDQTVTFVPNRGFRPGERVLAAVSAGMRDTLGAAVQNGWQFDVSPPQRGVSFGTSVVAAPQLLTGFLFLAGDFDHDGSNDLVEVTTSGFSVLRHMGNAWIGGLTRASNVKGAALGDMDGDGDLDVVTISTGCTNLWWVNDGMGSFVVAPFDLGTNATRSVAVSDFDNDGDLDVFVGCEGTNQLWLNDGTGSFAPSGESFSAQDALLARAADFNGDGWFDLALVGTNGLGVWLNDGECRFVQYGAKLPLVSPSFLEVGDFDCDGSADLLILDANAGNTIRLNDGLGGFTGSNLVIGGGSSHASVADMDGDGDLDILTAGALGGDGRACHLWICRPGKEFFASGLAYDVPGPGNTCVADFNNDGRMDVVSSVPRFGWYRTNCSVGVEVRAWGSVRVPEGAPPDGAMNTRRGPTCVGECDRGDWFRVAKLTSYAAEIVDIRVTGDGSAHFNVNLSLGSVASTGSVMTVTFAPLVPGWHTARVEIASNATNSPYVVNFVGEGLRPEIEVTNTTPRSGSVAFPTNGTIVAHLALAVDPATATSNTVFLHSAARGAIRGAVSVSPDGKTISLVPGKALLPGEEIEVVLTSGIKYAGCNYWLSGFSWKFRAAVAAGGGFFRRWGQVGIGSSASGEPKCVDVDSDGDLDLLMYREYLCNEGSLTFVPRPSFEHAIPWSYLVVCPYSWDCGDLDLDGDVDISLCQSMFESTSYRVWTEWSMIRRASNSFECVDSWRWISGLSVDVGKPSTRTADVNGDGRRDLVCQNWYDIFCYLGYFGTPQIGLMLNNSDGTLWSPGADWLLPDGCADYALSDIDGDGSVDVYAAFDGGDRVFLNDGTGQFVDPGWRFGTNTNERVYLWDLNADGNVDALVAGDSGVNLWTNRGDGFFSDGGQRLDGGKSWALGDVNGDGDIDVVCNSWSNGISVFLNSHGMFVSSGLIRDSASLSPSALADMDGDGDLDIVAGNTILLNESAVQVVNTNGLWVPSGAGPAKANGTFFRLDGGAQTAATNWFVITNAGLTSVEVLGITTTGTGAALFEVMPTSTIIAGLQSTTFGAAFRPTGEGVYTATVAIAFGSSSVPYVLNLKCVSGRFAVTNVVPAPNDHCVTTGTGIRIYFNRVVDVGTLNSPNIVVTSDRGGAIGLTMQPVGVGSEVVCALSRSLMAGERIRVTVTSRVSGDGDGTECVPYGWSFSVGAKGTQRLAHSGQKMWGYGSAALCDVDNDGDVDVVPSEGACLNNGTGYMTATSALPRWPIEVCDVDGDGASDVAVLSNGLLRVYRNNGGHFVVTNGWQVGREPADGVVFGDMDNDGDQDAVVISSSGMCVWLNDGTGRYEELRSRVDAVALSGPSLTDLDNDGDLDLVVWSSWPVPSFQFFVNSGEGGLLSGGTLRCSAYEGGWSVGNRYAVGDVDGNGANDIVVAIGGTNGLWLNAGDGTFSRHPSGITGGFSNGKPDLGDLDGDGDLDLLMVASCYTTAVHRFWLNDGTGGFVPGGLPVDRAIEMGGPDMRLVDLDGDGDLDAVVVRRTTWSTTTGTHVWFNELSGISVVGMNREPVLPGSAPSLAAGTDFGSVRFGQVATNTLFITNSSKVCVVVTGIATGGVSGSMFSVPSLPLYMGVLPSSIEPWACRKLDVVFSASMPGTHNAWIDVLSDATNTSYRINLTAVVPSYVVNASAGLHGGVTPSGAVMIPCGSVTCFTVTADAYYHIESVSTDGVTCASGGAIYTAVWDRVDIGGSLCATFAENVATNGTPEWWLASYGWATDFDTAALSDADRDGVPTWCEYVAGTSPTASNSVLCVGNSDGSFVLQWPSVVGRTYTVEWCSNLTSAVFNPFADGTDLPADPPENAYTNTTVTNLPSLFYRIRVKKPGP